MNVVCCRSKPTLLLLICFVVFVLVLCILYIPTRNNHVFAPQTLDRGIKLSDLTEKYDGENPSSTEPTSAVSKTKNASQCRPRHHIMFIKTHKCASSTINNILFRYAFNNDLNVALPERGNYLGNPAPFKASLVPKSLLPRSGLADIFATHTRLNYKEHSKILHKDTKWVTIVREPWALYDSMYSFYHLQRVYGVPLSEFKSKSLKDLEALPRFGRKLGRNQMLFDLGYDPDLSISQLFLAIRNLDEIFDLVMIVEHIDESLILLRHLMCWSMEEVVFFTKNARRKNFKSSLDWKTIDTLKQLNSADGILYNHFLAKHLQKVLEFGPEKMAKEVADLRNLRQNFYDECISRKTHGRDKTLEYKEYSDMVEAYDVRNSSDKRCLLLSMPELVITDFVRNSQRQRLHE